MFFGPGGNGMRSHAARGNEEDPTAKNAKFCRVDKPVGASTNAVVDALSLIHPTSTSRPQGD